MADSSCELLASTARLRGARWPRCAPAPLTPCLAWPTHQPAPYPSPRACLSWRDGGAVSAAPHEGTHQRASRLVALPGHAAAAAGCTTAAEDATHATQPAHGDPAVTVTAAADNQRGRAGWLGAVVAEGRDTVGRRSACAFARAAYCRRRAACRPRLGSRGRWRLRRARFGRSRACGWLGFGAQRCGCCNPKARRGWRFAGAVCVSPGRLLHRRAWRVSAHLRLHVPLRATP